MMERDCKRTKRTDMETEWLLQEMVMGETCVVAVKIVRSNQLLDMARLRQLLCILMLNNLQ